MLVLFLSQELSIGSGPSNVEGCLGKGKTLSKRAKDGRRKAEILEYRALC